MDFKDYFPASEARREVANLTWRKNPNTPKYKEQIVSSVLTPVFVQGFEILMLHGFSVSRHKGSLSNTHCSGFYSPCKWSEYGGIYINGTNQEKSRVVSFLEVFQEKSQNSVLLKTFPEGTE